MFWRRYTSEIAVNPPWNQLFFFFFLLYAPGKHLPLYFELYFLYKLALQNFQVQNSWHTVRVAGEREKRQERKSIFPGSEKIEKWEKLMSERELVATAVVKEALSSHSDEAVQRRASWLQMLWPKKQENISFTNAKVVPPLQAKHPWPGGPLLVCGSSHLAQEAGILQLLLSWPYLS